MSLIGTFACNDPATIDTSLLDVDILDVQVDDDFDISSFTVAEDSVLTFEFGTTISSRYPFGIYEDPVFGTATASIVAQATLTTVAPPTFTNPVVDSVILELNFSPIEPVYGDTMLQLGLDVFEITEILDAGTTYFTSFQAETESTNIGSFVGVPNFSDSVAVVRYQGDTLLLDTVPPQIQVKLDNSYGERVLAAGDVLTLTTDFVEMFRGLELRPTIPNSGIVAFDLGNFNSRNTSNVNGATIYIYYNDDGALRQYKIAVNSNISVKLAQQNHDFTGAPIESFFNDEIRGDSLFFVQGLTGPNAVVRLNDVDRLDGSIINGATLEVFATALNGDEGIRPLPSQLLLNQKDADGRLIFTRDFISAGFAGDFSIAGGDPEDIGDGIFKYTFNVASQLQEIVEGGNNEIFITVNDKVIDLRRAVLFGAGHSTYPIKLTVTYTNL